MDEFLRKQEAVMDKYDPQKKVALVVDEWGAWHAPLPGTNKDFLVQQNSLRDAMLAVAEPQHLRATCRSRAHGEYRPDDQRAAGDDPYGQGRRWFSLRPITSSRCMCRSRTRRLSLLHSTPALTQQGTVTLPRVDALAARDASGKLWLEITNLDPEKPVDIDADVPGMTIKSAKGETLTAPAVDSVNTFDAPRMVVPQPVAAVVKGGKLALTLAPKSVTVISLER
jgi:alpha-N-arabinofuranosidase